MPPLWVTSAFGASFTVTIVSVETAESQLPLFMVTEYDPESVTVIDGVVAPFDQRFPVGDDEVKMTLPPAQKVVAPEAVIVGVARSDGKANCFAGIGRRVVDVNLDRGYLRCAPVNPFGVASATKSKSVFKVGKSGFTSAALR